MRLSALTLAFLLSLTAPAPAQDEACIDPRTGQLDQRATADWRRFQAAADPTAARELAGLWYAEIANPYTGQIDYRYHALEPNGLFAYQSRVCDLSGLCSDFAGHGSWAARRIEGGTFAVMTMVSDLSRTNFCSITRSRLIGNQLQDASGTVWVRNR